MTDAHTEAMLWLGTMIERDIFIADRDAPRCWCGRRAVRAFDTYREHYALCERHMYEPDEWRVQVAYIEDMRAFEEDHAAALWHDPQTRIA